MKSQKRPFQRNVLNHCYQRTVDGGLLFYTQLDYLVWFTIVCVVARKHKVRILAMCPMPDHTHFSIEAASLKDLAAFMRDYSSIFVKEHNKLCHRSGPLFDGRFGSAVKSTEKSVRTNLIYVWNNPPERKLVVKAEEYRWNFLAYATSDHPFSKKLVIRDSRLHMQKAVREVRAMFQKGRYLPYAMLKRMFHPLTMEEKQQLTDQIITTYNVIDYKAALRYFNSYEDILTAVHSTTGAEHDLNETRVGRSDIHYSRMIKTVMTDLKPDDIHDILGYSDADKYEVFKLLRNNSYAMSEQIAKFLHLSR